MSRDFAPYNPESCGPLHRQQKNNRSSQTNMHHVDSGVVQLYFPIIEKGFCGTPVDKISENLWFKKIAKPMSQDYWCAGVVRGLPSHRSLVYMYQRPSKTSLGVQSNFGAWSAWLSWEWPQVHISGRLWACRCPYNQWPCATSVFVELRASCLIEWNVMFLQWKLYGWSLEG